MHWLKALQEWDYDLYLFFAHEIKLIYSYLLLSIESVSFCRTLVLEKISFCSTARLQSLQGALIILESNLKVSCLKCKGMCRQLFDTLMGNSKLFEIS